MAARNLAEIIPAFFTGPNGERLTPEQIARREEVAQSLMQQATDTSPNAGGWTSVLAKGAMGFASGYQNRRAEKAASANAQASAADRSALMGVATGLMQPSGGGGGGWTGMAPTADVMPQQAAAPQQMVANQPPVPGLQAAPRNSILPQSFLAAVDRTEGAGGYDTLFGHAQKGAFAGTDISAMPIRDVLAFTDPSGPYAQSVKAKIGRVATPVGRYQVVGTTLRNAVGALGLDPNQPFDAATQDRVAAYLATNRIRGAGSMPEKISALRSEWEGFRGVPDDQMMQIITDLQGVDPMAAQPGMAQTANVPMAATGYVDPMVSAQPAQPSVEVAQALAPAAGAFPPAPTPSAINPEVARILADPNADPRNVQMAQSLQQAAAELAQRQAVARQIGIDPALAADPTAYEAFVQQQARGRQTANVGGALVDQATGEVIYQAPQGPQSLINAGDGRLYDPNTQQWITAPDSQQGFRQATPDEIKVYGTNGQVGPDGRFYPVTPPQGTALSVDPATGAVTFNQGPGVKPLTEAQSKDSFFATRMTSAVPTIDQYEQSLLSLPEAAAGAVPAGRYLQSEEYQLARDAGDDFVAAYLRKDSGAALTKEEKSEYSGLLLPRPGDKPSVVEAKRRRRQVAIEAIKSGLPPSAVDGVLKAISSVEGADQPQPLQAENPLPPQPGKRLKFNPATGMLE